MGDQERARLEEAVLRQKLKTSFPQKHEVVHYIEDPEAPPFADPRREHWRTDRQAFSQGGQGQIFLQTCISGLGTHERRAVKKIAIVRDAGGEKRYGRELMTMIKFSDVKYSRHFVQSLGWYRTNRSLCIAMEYLEHGDLHTYLDALGGPMPEVDCRHIIHQVLLSLEIMHNEGFVHGDIKPKNILIKQVAVAGQPHTWWVKLADFGISKRARDVSGATTLVGTPEYMAPELKPGTPAANLPLADIWSVGVMAYHMLTRESAFPSTSHLGKYCERPDELFPVTALVKHGVSEEAQRFIRALMAPDPEQRPSSAKARADGWVQVHRMVRPPTETNYESDSSEMSETASHASTRSDERDFFTKPSTVSEPTIMSPVVPTVTPTVIPIISQEIPANLGGFNHNWIGGGPQGRSTDALENLATALGLEWNPYGAQVKLNKSPDKPPEMVVDDSVPARGSAAASAFDWASAGAFKESIRKAMDAATKGAADLIKSAADTDLPRYKEHSTAESVADSQSAAELRARIQDSMDSATKESALLKARVHGYTPPEQRTITMQDGAQNIASVSPKILINKEQFLKPARDDTTKRASRGPDAPGPNIQNATRLQSPSPIPGKLPPPLPPRSPRPIEEEMRRSGAAASAGMNYEAYSRDSFWPTMPQTAPELRRESSAAAPSAADLSPLLPVDTHRGSFVCPLVGCTAKPFRRMGDLYRHCNQQHLDIVEASPPQDVNTATSVDSRRTHGHIPSLADACRRGDETAAMALIGRGADLEEPAWNGQTALAFAAEAGNYQLVEALIQWDALIDATSDDGKTPLFWAAAPTSAAVAVPDDSMKALTTLLIHGADIEHRDQIGQTPLSWAAACGQTLSMKELMAWGAKMETRSNDGKSPLAWAAFYGRDEAIKLLYDNGASMESPSNNMYTPLLWAIEKGHKSTAGLVLRLRSQPNTDKRLGASAIFRALELNDTSTIHRLLDTHPHMLEDRNRLMQTPLSWAAARGADDLVRLLLERGADIEARTSNGQTPLSLAAAHGNVQTARELLRKGASKESRSSNGQTPLSWAAMYGRVDVVNLLLEHGAWTNVRSHNGQTPLDWAMEKGQDDVVSILRKWVPTVSDQIVSMAI